VPLGWNLTSESAGHGKSANTMHAVKSQAGELLFLLLIERAIRR